MSDASQWHRVNKATPCPICGRPDWCLISHNEELALCSRVESKSKCGEAGWLHKLTPDPAKPPRWSAAPKHPSAPRPGLGILAKQCQDLVDNEELYKLSLHLNVSATALAMMGIGWTGYAWSFPMTDYDGNVLGIRLRFDDGRKRSVTGGKEGLFIPTQYQVSDDYLMVCEGPTDTAALLTMGFSDVVGRPSCNGGAQLLQNLIEKRGTSKVIIMSDGDIPGRRGAATLAGLLDQWAGVDIVEPPAGVKDAREWLKRGGTKEEVLSCLR